MGTILVQKGIGVVYGGSNVGVMGALANAVLAARGEAFGVIPRAFADKVGHSHLTQYHIGKPCTSEKPACMNGATALSPCRWDGYPGRIFRNGHLVATGFHKKPCGVLNVCGFYDGLFRFLDYVVEQRFLKSIHREMILVDTDPERLLDKMDSYEHVAVDKWMDRK
jgi:uncharacterized protein (TIGR00730 family)